MKITDGAKQLLENFLNEKGAEGIRLSSALDAADHNLRLL